MDCRNSRIEGSATILFETWSEDARMSELAVFNAKHLNVVTGKTRINLIGDHAH